MPSAVSAIAGPRESRLARPTDRSSQLSMEGAYDVAARVTALTASGVQVADLSIGQPSWATPEHIVEAGLRSLRDGDTRYTPVSGLAPLRAAIADSLHQRGIVAADPSNILVTPGAKPALFYAMLALLDAGSEVLIPDPGFPVYSSVAAFAGATAVRYAHASVEEIERRVSPRTRVLILNSPGNPTGHVFRPEQLEQIAGLVERHGLTVISDECYGRLVYGDRTSAPSIASHAGLAGRTIVVDSFSKTYAMTGWRLGFALAPDHLTGTLRRIAVNVHSCTPEFVQRAGIAALSGTQGPLQRMRSELRGRRDVLTTALNALPGISCSVPDGAFYALADVSRIAARLGYSTEQFADWLLTERGVAAVAGTAFGPAGYGHVRFSFAAPPDQIALAIERLQGAVAAAVNS